MQFIGFLNLKLSSKHELSPLTPSLNSSRDGDRRNIKLLKLPFNDVKSFIVNYQCGLLMSRYLSNEGKLISIVI